MQPDLFKICADSLRTFSKEKYDVKLKAAHAHELVAVYFGYSSKNAMLADTKYPIRNMNQAEIIVLTPDDVIDRRRNNLKGLSPELPDSYALGEAVYVSLFSDEWWKSQHPPFRSFEKLALYLVENNDMFRSIFNLYPKDLMRHTIDVQKQKNVVLLTVYHWHLTIDGKNLCDGKTTILLTRIAGHIGYGNPQVNVERWTADARRTLESLGVQP